MKIEILDSQKIISYYKVRHSGIILGLQKTIILLLIS